jgi:uncharacterized delta-60 repeat protein
MTLLRMLPWAIAWIVCAGAAPAAAAPGDLDGSLAGVGWARTLEVRAGGMNYLPGGAAAAAAQPDGKIVAAGALQDGLSNRYFGVFRFLADGRLDPSFGAGGWTAVDLGSFEEARAVVLQADGRIVVAGETDCSTSRCFAAMRFNPGGSVDGSFGTGGVVRKEFRLEASFANDVAIDPQGRIVLVGTRSRGTDGQDSAHVCVVRLLPDGRLDPGFSRDGAAVLDHGYGNDSAEAVALQGRKIVVAGKARDTASGELFGVARFRGDGRLDHSFGRRGHRLVGFGSRRHAGASALAATRGGRLVVAGSATVPDHAPQMAVARLTRNGALDRSFGRGGRLRISPGPFGGHALAVAAQSDRRILVAGRVFTDSTFDPSDWALLRYSRGGLDRSFGAGGIVRTDFGTGSDEAAALAVVPGGVVAAGTIYSSLGIARYVTE